jgi:hypothetical protein
VTSLVGTGQEAPKAAIESHKRVSVATLRAMLHDRQAGADSVIHSTSSSGGGSTVV